MLKHRNAAGYKWAISGRPKAEQKRLYRRFTFLCDTVSECIPLNEATLDLALDLLSGFCEQHALKHRFRNSLNDILILAAAVHAGDEFRTEIFC